MELQLKHLRALTEGLGCADIVDAMMQTQAHRAHIVGLVSPEPGRALFGPALTIGYMPVRKDLMDPERHSLGPFFYRAIGERDPAGHVLVMASGGHPDTSLAQMNGAKPKIANEEPKMVMQQGSQEI